MTELIEKSQFNLTSIPSSEIDQMRQKIQEMKNEITQDKQRLKTKEEECIIFKITNEQLMKDMQRISDDMMKMS